MAEEVKDNFWGHMTLDELANPQIMIDTFGDTKDIVNFTIRGNIATPDDFWYYYVNFCAQYPKGYQYSINNVQVWNFRPLSLSDAEFVIETLADWLKNNTNIPVKVGRGYELDDPRVVYV